MTEVMNRGFFNFLLFLIIWTLGDAADLLALNDALELLALNPVEVATERMFPPPLPSGTSTALRELWAIRMEGFNGTIMTRFPEAVLTLLLSTDSESSQSFVHDPKPLLKYTDVFDLAVSFPDFAMTRPPHRYASTEVQMKMRGFVDASHRAAKAFRMAEELKTRGIILELIGARQKSSSSPYPHPYPGSIDYQRRRGDLLGLSRCRGFVAAYAGAFLAPARLLLTTDYIEEAIAMEETMTEKINGTQQQQQQQQQQLEEKEQKEEEEEEEEGKAQHLRR